MSTLSSSEVELRQWVRASPIFCQRPTVVSHEVGKNRFDPWLWATRL